MINFLLGFFVGLFILEPIVINFIYFTNISLFTDVILTPKNKKKLQDYYFDEKRNKKL